VQENYQSLKEKNMHKSRYGKLKLYKRGETTYKKLLRKQKYA